MKHKSYIILFMLGSIVLFTFTSLCLQRELQSLQISLQNLQQSFAIPAKSGIKSDERPLPPPPAPQPPPPTSFAGPKLIKTRHYYFTTPQGNKIDIAFGLRNTSKGPQAIYDLVMVGPKLQTPNNEAFIKILKSRDEAKKEIAHFPPFNEKVQAEYVIFKGQSRAAEQNLEMTIREHLDNLESTYSRLQKIYLGKYQKERDPNRQSNQSGSIYGTSMEEDENYVQELTDFIDKILSRETDFYKAFNADFYTTYLIPTLKKYFAVVTNFGQVVSKFMSSFGDIQRPSNLWPSIHTKKFNIDFETLKQKQEKAQEYYDKIYKPSQLLAENVNNILKTLEIESLKIRPKTLIEQFYDSLITNISLPSNIEKERPKSVTISTKPLSKDEAKEKARDIEREQEERRKTMSVEGFKNLQERVETYRKSLSEKQEKEESDADEEWSDEEYDYGE